jgi:hypothetical protein
VRAALVHVLQAHGAAGRAGRKLEGLTGAAAALRDLLEE